MTCFTNYEELPLVLTVKQVQRILGVSKNTAYGLIYSNRIQNIRVGRQIRISKASLIEFLEGQSLAAHMRGRYDNDDEMLA